MDMVVTGIQPPKSMQKTENSQVTSRSIPIPAASASHHIVSSYSDSQKNSAFVSSRLEKDSPQRSAGSFNVHPIRKPIMSSELKDHHSTASEVDYDESDVVMCWSNPAAGVGAPSCTLSLINANSWEDQSVANPKLSSDYLQRCEIEEPKTLNVGVNVASITSDMIRISSADSMSTASSRSVVSHAGHDSPIKSVSFSQKFVKEDELRHSPGENVSDYPPSSHVLCKEEALIYKEKLISMEEDDTFAYSLQQEFWTQNGTLCESDAILQDDQMVDTLFIDIPASGSSNESAKITYAGIHAAHAKNPVSTMSTFDRINMGSSYSINSSDSLQYSVYGILGSSPSLGEIDFCETFLVAGVDESSHPEKKHHQISLMRPRGEENHHVNNVVRDPYNWMYSKGQHIMSRHEDESMIIRGSHLLVSSSSNSMHNISLNIPQDSNSSYRVAMPNGEINTGRSPLSRSCSLSNIQPICHEREHCPPLTETCSLGTVGLARCKKRSFSAANLQLSESLTWPNAALMHGSDSVGTNAASKQEIKSQSGQDQAMQQRATKKQLNQHQIQQKQQRVQLPYDGNHINDGVRKQTRPKLAQKLRRRHGTATDPQSIAARTRREKFSDRIRMLQSLVPKGERLDTVSMLGQTLEYIRFLQHQVWELYHGPGTSSPLMYSSAKSEKWKDFIEAPSTTTTTTNAPAAPNCTLV